ncbi:H-NS histone family protein [Variovorax paradoxus]|nr:H-NS histone family protein [Variovorax paradoxus]
MNLRRGQNVHAKVPYRHQQGHSWSGRGPCLRWLKEAIEAGQALEQLAA